MNDIDKLMDKLKKKKPSKAKEDTKEDEKETEEEAEEDQEDDEKEIIPAKTEEKNDDELIDQEVAVLHNNGIFRRELILSIRELIDVHKINTQTLLDLKKLLDDGHKKGK